MGWGNNNPKPPKHPCPPNNPHCQGLEPVDADITSWMLGITIVLLISSFVFFKMYPKKRIMITEFLSSVLALGVLVVMLVMFKKRKV